VVKRFRTLGQLRQGDPSPVISSEVPLVKKLPSNMKKHQYPLRAVLSLWSKIIDLNLNCQSLESGPSINETICDLIDISLSNEVVVEQIKNKFPERNQIVIVRSWESE